MMVGLAISGGGSRAAASASFPPIVGPVTYSVDGNPPYQNIGDGGLFDNLGTESLATLFLNAGLAERHWAG